MQGNPLVDKPHLHAASMIPVREGGAGRRPDSDNRDLVENERPGGKLQLYPAGSLKTNLLLKNTVSHRQRYKECIQVPYMHSWPASRVQSNSDLIHIVGGCRELISQANVSLHTSERHPKNI